MTISVILTVIAGWRARSLKVLPLYLSISGMIYVFEYVILVLFESYVYKPEILHNPYFDSVLGAAVSDGFIVPSAGICVAVFDLGFWWVTLIALLFVGVEESFVYLRLYHHIWWNSGYTFVGLIVCFEMSKWIWRLLREEYQHRSVQFMILYLCNMVIQATTVFVSSAVFHLIRYNVNWFGNPTRGHVALATLIVLVDSCFFAIVVLLRARFGWYGLLLIGVFLLNDGLMTTGMLQFRGAGSEVIVLGTQAVVLYLLTKVRNIVALQADGHNTERN